MKSKKKPLDVVALYPEVKQIGDAKLRQAVVDICQELWELGKWDDPASIPTSGGNKKGKKGVGLLMGGPFYLSHKAAQGGRWAKRFNFYASAVFLALGAIHCSGLSTPRSICSSL